MASKKGITADDSKVPVEITQKTHSKSSKKKKEVVVDSWEDEDVSSASEEVVEEAKDDLTKDDPQEAGSTPPPASMSPIDSYGDYPGNAPAYDLSRHGGSDDSPPRRPEKTDAVARRMIAGALGMRAVRPNEEQKAYDKAVREKERKRQDEQRENQRKKEEEAARSRQAIWDD